MPSPAKTKPASVETILVVEGEVLIRMPISEYLRDCGYRVLEAANAAEVITLFEKAEIEIDIIFSSIEMPGPMNGFALAQWVRTNRPGVNVLLANGPERAANAAADLCDDGPMLMRPYDPQIVIEHVKRLLAERTRKRGG
jgi:CheY-like chemotaxis protein